ncbi:hypothetical protein OESDEN_03765 [Oesophagostomum dentatum]|uniref:Uncharacterized protein n=1 Tax=Oesophagostomum dentatum TaxID=61180 RepID=A0A0B1TFF9_OESDE|nr:hypothetical protein OESDEN_03765 [Oesophagostomum dentatum]
MRRKDEEHRRREEQIEKERALERERERIRFEREQLEKERLQLQLQAALQQQKLAAMSSSRTKDTYLPSSHATSRGRHDYRDSRDTRASKISSSVHRRSAGDSRRPAAEDRSRSRHVGGSERSVPSRIERDRSEHKPAPASSKLCSHCIDMVVSADDMSPTVRRVATAHHNQQHTQERTMTGDIHLQGTPAHTVGEVEARTMEIAATRTVPRQVELEAHREHGDHLPAQATARLLGRAAADLYRVTRAVQRGVDEEEVMAGHHRTEVVEEHHRVQCVMTMINISRDTKPCEYVTSSIVCEFVGFLVFLC